MKRMSVCIPAYEMKGRGAEYLRQSFDALARQTFTDFEVVVSDHSHDDAVKTLCAEYAAAKKLDIAYVRNTEKRGNSSANINNAMRHARGAILKILFQDDFLAHERALADISRAFGADANGWLVTACAHTTDGRTLYRPFQPRYDDSTILFKNTISSPSVVAVCNELAHGGEPVLFDENLIWWMDLDFYKRCFQRYGMPTIVSEIGAINRVGEHQMTSSVVTERRKIAEFAYVLKKYRVKRAWARRAAFALRTFESILKKRLKSLIIRP